MTISYTSTHALLSALTIVLAYYVHITINKMTKEIKARLEYLRGEILNERISYGEVAELQDLAEYIDAGDVLLLEWAGVPESSN